MSLNLTVVNPDGPGFVQAAPASDFVVGASSSLNITSKDQIVAGSTIVPVDSQGRIAIFTQPSADLVVDVGGWFTDQSNAAGSDGLFVALDTPRRVLDTRLGLGHAGRTGVDTRFDLSATGAALVGNLTVTSNVGAGFVQVGPAKTMIDGATSSINTSTPDETVANSVIAPVNEGIGVYTSNGTDVILDTSGYMTAA